MRQQTSLRMEDKMAKRGRPPKKRGIFETACAWAAAIMISIFEPDGWL